MSLPRSSSKGRLIGTTTALSSARRAPIRMWPVCSRQATVLIECIDRRSQRRELVARPRLMQSAIWHHCIHETGEATLALRLGNLDDLDKRGGVRRIQQTLTKIVLRSEERR